MEVRLFTLFSRLAQAENWTKTKDFHLSCKFNIFGAYADYITVFRLSDFDHPNSCCLSGPFLG